MDRATTTLNRSGVIHRLQEIQRQIQAGSISKKRAARVLGIGGPQGTAGWPPAAVMMVSEAGPPVCRGLVSFVR